MPEKTENMDKPVNKYKKKWYIYNKNNKSAHMLSVWIKFTSTANHFQGADVAMQA